MIDCVPQILGESNFLNWGPQRLGYGVKHNKFESRNISLSIPRVFDETKWIQISCWTNTHNSYLDLFSFSKLYLLVQFLFDRQSLWDITTLWDHTINRRPQLSCYAIFWRKIVCKCKTRACIYRNIQGTPTEMSHSNFWLKFVSEV